MTGRTAKTVLIIILAVILAVGVYRYTRPLPAGQAVAQMPTQPKTESVNLPWPAGGQAAVGATGYGLLASHQAGQPVPIASIAKVITALAVLQQKPLASGQAGPTITLDSTDANYYNYYVANDGSVAKVVSGETLSEYQALQAMLIPSANNMADSLARWSFGSMQNYITYANRMVKNLGLTATTVGGASGFADDTTSTAEDLVKLGLAAMANPVIAQVVGQSDADLPVAGTVTNVNWLLGQDGVVGIKTGNTDKAGSCFLFAANRYISGRQFEVVGAVLGQPDGSSAARAIDASVPLISVASRNFQLVSAAKAGQTVGEYKTAWSSAVPITVKKALDLVAWKGQPVTTKLIFNDVKTGTPAGSTAGTLTIHNGNQSAKTAVVLSRPLPSPSFWWRIFRH